MKKNERRTRSAENRPTCKNNAIREINNTNMSFSKLSPGGGAYKAKLRSFRATMESIAGSETESLLLAYFKSRHGKNILPKLKDELWAPQLSDLIDKIKNCYNLVSNQNKKQFLSLLSPVFTRKQLKDIFNFSFSKKSFAIANKHATSVGSGMPVPRKTGTNTIVTEEIKQRIAQFMTDNSHPSSCQTVSTRQKNKQPSIITTVRCINNSFQSLYFKFLEENPDINFSYPTFRDQIPKQFKKAKRRTDVCAICEQGKINAKKLESCIDEEEKKKLLDQDFSYRLHLQMKSTQRNYFKDVCDALQKGEAVLVFDYKENISLNITHTQLNKDFYSTPQRTMFGVVLGYVNDEGEFVKHYFDIMSKCLTHNGFFSCSAIDIVLSHQEFKCHKFTKLHLFSDNGAHFINYEFLNYISTISTKHSIDHVGWSQFCAYHGKCWCDSRFSLVTRLLNNYVAKGNRSIKTEQALFTALQEETTRINGERSKLNKVQIQSTQLLLEIKEIPQEKIQIDFNAIKCFYHFEFDRTKPNSMSIKRLSVPNFESLEMEIKTKSIVRTVDDRTIKYGNDTVENDNTLDSLLVATGTSLVAADVKASNIIHQVKGKAKAAPRLQRISTNQVITTQPESKKRKRDVTIEEQSFSGLLDLFKDCLPLWKKPRTDSHSQLQTNNQLNKQKKQPANKKQTKRQTGNQMKSKQQKTSKPRQNSSSENPYQVLYKPVSTSSQTNVQKHNYGTRQQCKLNEGRVGSYLSSTNSLSSSVSNWHCPNWVSGGDSLVDDSMQVDEFVDAMEIITDVAGHSNIVSQHIIVA